MCVDEKHNCVRSLKSIESWLKYDNIFWKLTGISASLEVFTDQDYYDQHQRVAYWLSLLWSALKKLLTDLTDQDYETDSWQVMNS